MCSTRYRIENDFCKLILCFILHRFLFLRRKATISGSSRTAGHAHFYIFNDWMFGSANSVAKSHSNASIIWSVSLHGCGIPKRTAVLRSNSHHVHASQIPTWLYVSATGNHLFSYLYHTKISLIFFLQSSLGSNQAGSSIHADSVCLFGRPVAHQIVPTNFDSISIDVGGDGWYSEIFGLCFYSKGIEDIRRHHAGNDKTCGRRRSSSLGWCGGGHVQ